MICPFRRVAAIAIAAIATYFDVAPAAAITFTTSYTDGASWNQLYAQGFKASVHPSPNPGLGVSDTVNLDRFQFFKSGTAITATNVRLAILSNYFAPLSSLTTSNPVVVGLSTNTIADTNTIATGGSITFNFNHVPIVYGADTQDELANNNYAAVFVNVSESGQLTPVLVPVLIADYIEVPPGSGNFRPESDYGDPDINYPLSASNFINGDYFATFNAPYADATFIATFNLPAGVPGDYNGDKTVNAADYTVYRNNLGLQVTLPNDETPGSVQPIDYEVWKSHYGMMSPGSTSGAAVPEPNAIALLLLAGLFLTARRRTRLANK
jgi:hypothetical protein